MNGTPKPPKRPERLYKKPNKERIRQLAKILFREPTIEELRLENRLYIENIMKANKKPCQHKEINNIKLRNIHKEKIGNSEYLFITCAKCGKLLEIRKR